MRNHRWLALVALLSFWPKVHAAPPTLEALFPSGGQRGTTIQVVAAGTFDRWPVQVWTDDPTITVQPGKVAGQLAVTIAAAAAPGTYWLRLFDAEGASSLRPFLVGTLPEVLEKEPNDDPKAPHVLDKANVVVNAKLEKLGDVDTFAVKLTKGQSLVAAVEAYHTLRSPMDAVLQILSADAFVLEQNNDYREFDPQVAFTAPRDGTYLVRVFAFPSVPNSAIRFACGEKVIYSLTLTTQGFVEYAMPLAVEVGKTTNVEPFGWNIGDDAKAFPVQAKEAADALKQFDPRLVNPFFVRVEVNACVLSAKSSREKPQSLELPVTISGRFERPGSHDFYRFTGKKGQKLSVRMEARALGFDTEAVLRLTDADGKMLAQAQAKVVGSDPVLDATLPADGTYGLDVRDLYNEGGLRHAYRMRVGAAEPGFNVKLAKDRYVLTAGVPLEIPATIEPRGGFKGEVTLSAIGLPAGVKAEVVAGKLRLTAEPGAASGAFLVAGQAKGGSPRLGRVAVTELATSTEHLWLSVVNAKK